MTDEIEYVREVCEAGYGEGRDKRGATVWYRADALCEATYHEALAVIEAAERFEKALAAPDEDDLLWSEMGTALDAYRAAVRAHRERTKG